MKTQFEYRSDLVFERLKDEIEKKVANPLLIELVRLKGTKARGYFRVDIFMTLFCRESIQSGASAAIFAPTRILRTYTAIFHTLEA